MEAGLEAMEPRPRKLVEMVPVVAVAGLARAEAIAVAAAVAGWVGWAFSHFSEIKSQRRVVKGRKVQRGHSRKRLRPCLCAAVVAWGWTASAAAAAVGRTGLPAYARGGALLVVVMVD